MQMSKATAKSIYDVHPSIAMVQKWIETLPEKTGRSLDEWMKYIRKEGPKDEKACRDWLAKKHDLGTNTVWWLAERAHAKDPAAMAEEDPAVYLKMAAKYVDDMYAGPKAVLRPIHDALIKLGRSLGKDLKICPCKTIVPFFRRHVIAQIKPATRTRIDFGLALGDLKATSRLIDTGGYAKKDRITHRIALTSLDEIDGEVKKWLKAAYDRDAR